MSEAHFRLLTPGRWLLLAGAFVVMMIISIYQYSWFLFADRIHRELGWGMARLGFVYTVFHYTSTLVLPLSGYIADTYGPRRVAIVGSVLVGIGLFFCGLIKEFWAFCLFYGLGGIGGGILYGVSTATAVKWFPDKRGMSSGIVVFGFGAGTSVFNFWINHLLEHWGLSPTLVGIGLGSLLTLVPLSLMYRYPDYWDSEPGGVLPKRDRNYGMKPSEMLRTPQWYAIYVSFSLTVSVVLMFGAQMKTMARHYQVPDFYFHLLLIFFPLANGASRIIAGAVSDRLGREKTMAIFYTLLGLCMVSLIEMGEVPLLFTTMVVMASLLGGAPFAIYPATIGDYFGSRFATANYGITYTAKAWAGVISGWLSGYLVAELDSYKLLLMIMAGGAFLAAILSNPWTLRPPRRYDASLPSSKEE